MLRKNAIDESKIPLYVVDFESSQRRYYIVDEQTWNDLTQNVS